VAHNDLIVSGCTIITMDPQRRIIENGEIVVRDGMIASVGQAGQRPSSTVGSTVGSPSAGRDTRRIDASGKVVFPGLINTHTHIFQTLIRGLGQDEAVWDWFANSIDPVVDSISEDDVYIASVLGSLEAVKCGTTTILDYNYPHTSPDMADRTIGAFRDVGIRGILARSIIDTGDVHKGTVHTTRHEMDACRRLLETYRDVPDDMIRVWLAPYTIFSTSRDAFIEAKDLAREFDTWLTVHAATPSTVDSAVQLYGMDDIAFEESIGFLGPNVLAVHCCAPLAERTLDTLRAHDTKVSHNPISNAYLGEGIAPIAAMLRKGISVGLATDGPASNNNHDMLQVMKFAALLQKVAALDPTAISSMKILEMATIEGARCVGMESVIGSIEPGKRADLMILDLKRPNTVVCADPVAALVYSATQENVDTVIVNGRPVMENRTMTSVNEEEILSLAQEAGTKLVERTRKNVKKGNAP
jgi:5-methylthioadenosine/S-adenosylhomocysteine deaminase